MKSALSKLLQPQIAALRILVVDDDQHMRKVVRTILAAIGVKTVYDASDGAAGLEAVRKYNPDLVIVEVRGDNRVRGTDRHYQNLYIMFLYFRDGLVYRWREFSNPDVYRSAVTA